MMRQKACSLFCLLLCLSLTVAGLARGMAGVAMAQVAGQTQIVICGGDGAELVTLNAAGQPVNTPKEPCATCPDCILGQGLAGHREAALPQFEGQVRRVASRFIPPLVLVRLIQTRPARAPPQEA